MYSDTTKDCWHTNAATDASMLTGRTFTVHDEEQAPNVAVVNREFARKLFGPSTRALVSISSSGTASEQK